MNNRENLSPHLAIVKLYVFVALMSVLLGCDVTTPLEVTDARPNKLNILLFPKERELIDTDGNSHVVKRAMVVSLQESISKTVEMYIDANEPTTFPRSEFCCVSPSGQPYVDELNRDLRQSPDSEAYRSVFFSHSAVENGMVKCELKITTPNGRKIVHHYNLKDDEVALPE